MNIDTDKVDEAVLALLQLGLHEGNRAWKGSDWEAMQRLHAKGHISDPVGKAKSVVFTDTACGNRSGCCGSGLVGRGNARGQHVVVDLRHDLTTVGGGRRR